MFGRGVALLRSQITGLEAGLFYSDQQRFICIRYHLKIAIFLRYCLHHWVRLRLLIYVLGVDFDTNSALRLKHHWLVSILICQIRQILLL